MRLHFYVIHECVQVHLFDTWLESVKLQNYQMFGLESEKVYNPLVEGKKCVFPHEYKINYKILIF